MAKWQNVVKRLKMYVTPKVPVNYRGTLPELTAENGIWI